MVATRPLLYLSIPGLALIIGIIYLRRQKKSQKDKDGDKHSDLEDNNCKCNNDRKMQKLIKCENNVDTKTASIEMMKNVKNDIDLDSNKLGKSAPIDIAYGMKSLNKKCIDNNIICEDDYLENMEKSSIEKDDDLYLSSVDLPDSPNNKKKYLKMQNFNNNCVEEPVIIKATVSPNISLSNSFIENKYTEEAAINEKENEINATDQMQSVTITSSTTTCINNDIDDDDKTLTDNNNSKDENLSLPVSEYSSHSGDSGKGSSLTQSERVKITNYDFIIPTSLIGRLCGRKKIFLNEVKSKSGVNITLKNHNMNHSLKICSLHGTEKEINTALTLLRNRFPLKRYPNVTLQKIEYAEPQKIVQLSTDYTSCLQLRLIEGINNDVTIASVMSGSHIFVQHPSHPTFQSINILQSCLNASYETGEAPPLPELTDNAICVARVNNLWYRVQIIFKDSKEQKCVVKLLDFGGYFSINNEDLKQIRADFMTIPFQATECLLSNIEPTDSEWSLKALETLYHLTAGLVLQAQIVRYNASNLPEINLYAPLSRNSVIFINKELVARGFAKWITEK